MQEPIMEESVETPTSMGTPIPPPGGATATTTSSTTTTTTTTASANNSRRPPRKSTLTQQQKNQKRQRATQDQLLTLEREFNKNPTPTALVRERIAEEINMTERSVQIWFQNRRAKIKNIAKKSIENGEDCNEIPESMRRYLALQAMESGKPLASGLLSRGGTFAYGSGMLLNTDSSSSKVVIHHFSCRSLSIGTWRRIGQSAMDLVIFYSPEKCCVTYYINNDSAGYKIEYPFAYIKNITLDNGDPATNAEGAAQRPGGLVVELTRPPNFFMDSSGSGGFYQCGDFTEDQQASHCLVHHLGGHPKILSGQLAKLVALESFQNRHHVFDPNALAVSAPVSPINHRPASQPNHHAAQNPMGMFHDTPFGVGVGLNVPRGHKRQRSRSVPVAIDFSMLRHPMPSFLVPEPPAQPYVPQHSEIVAPVPQYHNGPSPMGPTLSIDTSAGFGMNFNQQFHPMSATTAPSPSDFGTPGFFTSGPAPENIPASNMATSFNPQFMSPMPPDANLHAQAPSPMHSMGSADPVIANQSPPLNSMGRSASADIYHLPQDSAILDDGMFLDMSSKQPMTLPFRNSMHDDQQQPGLDMNPMVGYSTVDPSSLAPHPM
ncbi:uncharacterized protein PV09_05176 [Verruconis gallopava]|uniref:Homeobox domain-containing protein n=1 Tax=Verruconis gallopava TaxID=253628 RepID=A0A0D2AAS5_9PEZI|nr:uncharacterized protein PV09_05176 [Verruconis gallopava]KIW03883.1 hypothetical protein PV09_05176 [Verruconis gallopava]